MAESITIAVSICFINTVAALIIISIANRKDQETFNKIVFSSMVIRFIVLVGSAYAIVFLTEVHRVAFAIAFLSATFVFTFAEILYINYKRNN